MSYRVSLPDGRTVEFPDEVSKEEAAKIIERQLSGARPEGGFLPAAKAGLASLQQNMADLGANIGLRDRAGALADIEGLEDYKARTFQPTEEGWTQAPWTKFKETLGGSLPYVLAPIGGGLAGGPVGAGIASLAQFTGSNLSRQREEGQEQQLGPAAAAAVPQAALDVLAFRLIPGIRSIMGVPENVAANIAKQGAGKVAADYTKATGKAMTAEGATEAAQQFLERLQAGLATSPNDPQARQEYVESLIGGAVLGGTLAVPGRHIERGREQDRFNEKKRAEDAAFEKEEAVRQQAEAEAHQRELQDPAYLTDIDKRWTEASARMQEFKDRMKAVPAGEFAKEDKAEIGRAMNEYGQSDEYQSIRKAYKEARGQIEALKNKMGPEANREPELDLREPLELTPPEGVVGMPIQDRMARVLQDPELTQRVLTGAETFPDLSPQENEALKDALKLQLQEREFEAKVRQQEDTQEASAELAERQALMQQAAQPPAPPTRRDLQTERFRVASEQLEGRRDPLEGDPNLDETAVRAFNQQPERAVPVAPDITVRPDAERHRQEVEGLYDALAQGHDAMDSAMRASERAVAAKQTEGLSDARARLDMIAKEADPYRRELVRLRDEQQAALREVDGGLIDVAAGFYFGGARPEGASSFRDGVIKQVEQARDRYIQATLQEAATNAAAAGKPFPQDQAIQIASMLRDRFDEYIDGRLSQIAVDDEYAAEGVERKNIKPTFKRQVEFKPNRSGLMPDEAAALQDELFELRNVRSGMIEPKLADMARRRDPKAKHVRELARDIDRRIAAASQRLMRHIKDNGEAQAPRTKTQRPKTSFAQNMSRAQRALVAPKSEAKVVKPDLKPQQREEDILTKVGRVLQNKEAPYGVRKALEKAQAVLEEGGATPRLLDAVEELADRALRGQRTRDPATMRDLQDALKTLAEVQRTDPEVRKREPELPGLEPTVFERSTAKNFERAPEVRKAREALDAAKELKAKTDQWQKERREDLKDRAAVLEHAAKMAQAEFVAARQAAMDAWRKAMQDWHFSDKIAAAGKKLRDAESALKRQEDRAKLYEDSEDKDAAKTRETIFKRQKALAKEVDQAQKELDSLQYEAKQLVDDAEAYAKSMEDKNVQRKRKELEEADAKVSKARKELAEIDVVNKAQVEARQARLAADKAVKERDDRSAEIKQRRDKWEARLVQGLGLPGRRRVEGQVEKVKTPEELADEKHIAEIREAQLAAATVAVRGKTEHSDGKRAAGPVNRDAVGGGKHLEQARRTPAAKDPDKPREDEEAVQRETAQAANEDAAKIKKEIGDKPTRAKLEADRVAVQAEIAGLVTKKDVEDKAVVKALERLWELEEALEPYRQHDMAQAEAQAKIDRKKEQAKKRARKQRNIRQELNERNVNAARKRKAVEEIEEDYDAQETLMFGERDEDGGLHFSGGSYRNELLKLLAGEQDAQRNLPFDLKKPKNHKFQDQNFYKVAEMLEDMFPEHSPYRAIAGHLANMFAGAPELYQGRVKVFDHDLELAGRSIAFYADKHHVVVLDTVSAADPLTVLHELVHAATVHAIDTNPQFQKELTTIRDRVKRYIITPDGYRIARNLDIFAESTEDGRLTGDLYGLTNNHEFLAEAFSNPQFQQLLALVPSDRKNQSIWTRWGQNIARWLGFQFPERFESSALDDALKVGAKVMDFTRDELMPYMPYSFDAGVDAEGNKVETLHWGPFAPRHHIDSAIFSSRPSAMDKFTGNAVGLAGRVQFIDRHAAITKGIQEGGKAGKLTDNQMIQAEHDLRFGEQTTQTAGQFLTYGPVKRVREKVRGGTLESYEAQKGTNAVDIAKKLAEVGRAADWDEAYTEYVMGVTTAGQRANAIEDGWRRLSGNDAAKAKAEYDRITAEVNSKPEAKRLLKEAQDLYKEFNNGLIDFVVETGAVKPERAAALKRLPYIPWYRVIGNEVKLWVEGEKPITIGSIADNPDLKELVGDDRTILPFWTALHQNTFMLSRMGLRNKATMESANALKLAGFVSKIGAGRGPSGDSTIHYRVKGEDWFAVIDKDMYGIPADLIVKGMEGIKTMVPMWVRMLGVPANILRRMVTRSPAYLIRQIVRDPTNAAIIGGVDSVPIANALKHISKTVAGKNDEEHDLMRKLAISSNIYVGGAEDMEQFMRQIVGGEKAWRKTMNFFDNLALQADAATRAAVYEDAMRKGFTKAEAALRALEIQNFSRRGLSPGMQMLSTVIPFFNAQVQGLDVLYRSFKGDVPFAERLEIKRKLWARGMMLMAATWAYASMMQEDEDYLKARPQERYQNFLIKTPFSDDFVKIPIPFETGVIFKSLIEAAVDAASDNTTGKEAMKGLGRLAWQSIPGGPSWWMPAAVAPAIQAAFGQTAFGPIESAREKSLEPWARYRENTSEVAKAIGEAGNLSPVMIDHFIRGYTGALGLAAVRLLDPPLEKEGETPPSKTAADNLLFGSLFQRKESRYMIERAYERLNEINQAQKTFKELIAQGKAAEARKFAHDKANELAMADVAGMYKQQMGNTFAMERAIRNHPTMPQQRKDELLKRLREAQNRRAQEFFGRTELLERRA